MSCTKCGYTFNYHFSNLFLQQSSSSVYSSDTGVGSLDMVPQVPETIPLGLFWYPSSLCSSEWIISLFKLTDTFFCQVHSAIDLMSKFFLLNVLLILKFSLGSLIKFLFLCCESLSFYSLAFISHEIKSLIIIQVSHLEVVSTAAFHRRIGQSFLVLYMLSSFVVYRGHFEY